MIIQVSLKSHERGTRCNSSFSEGEYIDLIANPEQFTGYAGMPANRIWSTIYNENCFGISELDLAAKPGGETTSSNPLGGVSESEEQCLEKRVYYKIISGTLRLALLFICVDLLLIQYRIARVNINPSMP